MQLLEHIIGMLAPHVCVGCRHEGTVLCKSCAAALAPPPHYCYGCKKGRTLLCGTCQKVGPLRAVFAAAIYDGLAKEVIHSLKFERAQAAAEPIAECMAARLQDAAIDLALPVPTANHRVRQRGYDQSALLARRLGKLKGLPYDSPLLRVGKLRQLGQSRDIRTKQLAGAFVVHRPALVQNKHVLIIDDVLTTGSTLEAGARALLEAGAASVSAAVFAVAPPPDKPEHLGPSSSWRKRTQLV